MSVTERNRGGLRVLAGVGATLGTALAAWTLRQLLRSPTDAVLDLLIIVPSSLAAALGWWFAIRGDRPRSRAVLRSGCLGGLVVGGTGFLLGFIGPIILAPEANQGPMLGIFVTGPAGFVIGVIGGLVVGAVRQRSRIERTPS